MLSMISTWGIIAALVLYLILQEVVFFKGLNDMLLDQFILANGERQPHGKILVIGIDDQSTDRLGAPIPRSHYVKLIQKLNAFGAKTIVFDLIFQDEREPISDSLLAAATASAGNVIHSFKFFEFPESVMSENGNFDNYAIGLEHPELIDIISCDYATFPSLKFISHFEKAGFFNAMQDPDRQIRRIPLCMAYADTIFPALTLMTLFDYFDIPEKSIEIERTFWGRNIILDTPDSELRIPVNPRGQVLLNFYGILEVFELVPLHWMLDLLDAIDENHVSAPSLPMLDGKIVLIGNLETSVDQRSTPFSSKFHGVGFHATLLSNVLNGDLLREASAGFNVLVIVLLNLLLIAGFIFYVRSGKSIWQFLLYALALFVCFNMTAYFISFGMFYVWFNLMQIDIVLIMFSTGLVFTDKMIRIKSLTFRIKQLEDDIFSKLVQLESLDLKIHSQGEQHKLLEYFTNQLQAALEDRTLRKSDKFENLLNTLNENKRIVEGKLLIDLEQLKKEKQAVEKQKELLELEKNLYEKLLSSRKTDEIIQREYAPAIESQASAAEISEAFQYFKNEAKKGSLGKHRHFGIIARDKIYGVNGEEIRTEMGDIFEKLARMGEFDSTVLVTGEHGTGKELIAKAIHEHSRRANRRLVILNCAAIPENLIESELFGHVKGAFTNAVSDRMGAFECADGGTLFLDEIGDLQLGLQAKLLRVLQEREFQKVGSNKTIQVDVRVIAATNKDLEKLIERNDFRGDLYFRLNVVHLHNPPLRERRADIPFLIDYFLNEFNLKYDRQLRCSDEFLLAAMCFDWPGNIRMLQHTLEQICVTTSSKVIGMFELPENIRTAYQRIFQSDQATLWRAIESALADEERQLLEAAKIALKDGTIDEFLNSSHLVQNQMNMNNCYDYLCAAANNLATILPTESREKLVRKTIVRMQEQLFQHCHDTKLARLSELYPSIEKILGRSRRQIDNWRKEFSENTNH